MISLLCPTRHRPAMALTFLRSAATMATAAIEVVFYVDIDDEETYAALTAARINDQIRELCGGFAWMYVDKRCTLSDTWNELAKFAGGDILGHLGDDVVFRTPGWNTEIEQAFQRHEDRICFVHGNDMIQGAHLGTHGFLHRNWVDAVGYFVPPYFSHDYNDAWLTEVADRLDRRIYLPNVVTDHIHPDLGKRPYDQTYRDHEAAGKRDNVAELYQRLEPERLRDAEKLRGVMT